MTIGTPTVLVQGNDGTDRAAGSAYTVPSHTPTAGALLLVYVCSGSTNVGAAPSSFVDSRGWTWNLEGEASSPNDNASGALYSIVAPTATAGTIAVTYGFAASSMLWHVVQVVTTLIPSVVQYAENESITTNPSFNFTSTPSSSNLAIAFISYNSGSANAITAGSGYTLLGTRQNQTSPTVSSHIEYDMSAANPIAFGTANASGKGVAGVEITETAPPAGGTVTYWNGTSEVALTDTDWWNGTSAVNPSGMAYWDGTAETAVTI